MAIIAIIFLVIGTFCHIILAIFTTNITIFETTVVANIWIVPVMTLTMSPTARTMKTASTLYHKYDNS